MMWIGFIIGAIAGILFAALVACRVVSDLNHGHDAIVRRLDERIASLRAAIDRLREVAK